MEFFTLFLLGFFGGTHCIGMCGGLSGALVWQLPPHLPRFILILLMNLARITTYVFIGILMGALSHWGFLWDQTHLMQMLLFYLANILLLFTGLYLAGLSSAAARTETIGQPIWRKLNPLLNKLLPIQSFSGCVGVGLLWGWLPCGLVYNASLYALGSGSVAQGGLLMLTFGLGTLPNLLLMGVFAMQLRTFLQKPGVRLTAGLLVCGVAAWNMIQAAV